MLFFTGKPTQPTQLAVESKGPNYIKIKWKHGYHYKAVLYSNITYTESKLKKKVETVHGNLEMHEIKNLEPFNNYTVMVITCVQVKISSVLCSDPSKKIRVTTNISGIVLLEIS